jgi:hypothetical protein
MSDSGVQDRLFNPGATMTPGRKILIATPCYGGLVTDHYLISLLALTRLLDGNAIEFDVRTISDSLITRARNAMASAFLNEASFTHLLFIDADLGFDPAALLRYLSFDKDVVCGVYPLKRLDVASLRASSAPTDEIAEAASYLYSSTLSVSDDNRPENGFLRAEYGATGFMLIARSVVERMAESYPELRYGADHAVSAGAGAKYAFFDTMVADGAFLPEDYSFCKRWRAIGGEIWIDLASRFSHVGGYVYKGDLGAAIGEAQRQGRFT